MPVHTRRHVILYDPSFSQIVRLSYPTKEEINERHRVYSVSASDRNEMSDTVKLSFYSEEDKCLCQVRTEIADWMSIKDYLRCIYFVMKCSDRNGMAINCERKCQLGDARIPDVETYFSLNKKCIKAMGCKTPIESYFKGGSD